MSRIVHHSQDAVQSEVGVNLKSEDIFHVTNKILYIFITNLFYCSTFHTQALINKY